MLSNYYTLRYVTSTLLSVLRGAYIREIFSQERDELVLAFKDTPQNLVLATRKEENVCFLHPRFARARANSANLLGACWNLRILNVSIHPADRILTLSLGNDYRLNVQFFGAKSNVILTKQDALICDSFKESKTLSGRPLVKPQGKIVYDFAFIQDALKAHPAAPAFSVVKNVISTFGSTLTREAFSRAGIPPSAPASDISASHSTDLQHAIASILQEVDSPAPRLYVRKDGYPSVFSIIPLRHLADHEERPFSDVHEAIRYFVYSRRGAAALEAQKTPILSSIRLQVEKARRTVTAIEEDVGEGQRADEYEEMGSLLLQHLSAITRGDRTLAVSSADRPTLVLLDPRLSPSQNAQRYFEKAKHARLALEKALRRRAYMIERIRAGEKLLATFESAITKEEMRKLMKECTKEMGKFGIGEKGNAREELPFRLFTVDGGFEVLVGKNSSNNDLLTMKYARPNDLWFHARGAGGSHVLLKVGSAKGEPGRKAKEQAAALAAYYSKMRNATIVPVAVTEKKYVRKPKGAPAGTVVLDREKVMFARPALPSAE